MQSSLDFTFHHAGVSVPNLDEAIAWYRDILGFDVQRRFPLPPLNAEIAFMAKGPLNIELFQVAGATPLPAGRSEPILDLQTHGTKHVAFHIADLDTFLEQVEKKGADVAMVVRDMGTACFLRDCAGNLIEFVERWP
jgi:methylmalonyl-CoA/ethylmalonyl-CoA epimerase